MPFQILPEPSLVKPQAGRSWGQFQLSLHTPPTTSDNFNIPTAAMRLLKADNIDTLELHEFFGEKIPPYAILSHTWVEGEEVSLQDLQAGNGPSKTGYQKILHACNQARRDGLHWVWVDTCCIDKASSAEISEAINSMYQWYKESEVCYAYLSDVADKFPWAMPPYQNRKSKWFTRAWTLQELIAPLKLIFYNRKWSEIGNRSDHFLAPDIAQVTSIPQHIIRGTRSLQKYSVAEKMSWAANRFSTRLEDRAYSLLGLFEINMPLLYGEGDKAFVRLQEEILKETDDHSILCWTVPDESPRAWTLESVFAKSPDDFSGSGDISGHLFDSGAPSAMTNRGLQLHLNLRGRLYDLGSHLSFRNSSCLIYDAALNAGRSDSGGILKQISIILVRTPLVSSLHSRSINRYTRIATPMLIQDRTYGTDMTEMNTGLIYIHKTLFEWEQDRFGAGGIHLQNIPLAPILCAPQPPGQSIHPYVVQSVFFSDIYSKSDDLFRPEPIGENMVWSKTYGCVVFGDKFRDSSQLLYTPDFSQSQFVLFGIESLVKKDLFYIFIAWDEEFIHFSVRQGSLGKVHLEDEFRLNKSFDYDGMVARSRVVLLDPLDPGTHRGNHRDMYGEVARTRTVIEDYDVEFILERENPDTAVGEAAGDRVHLLIRAESSKRTKTTLKKLYALFDKEYTKSTE